MSAIFRGKTLLVPLVITGLGVMTVASAQTVSSPFAKKAKKQAWETDAPGPALAPTPAPRAAPAPRAMPTFQNPQPVASPLQESARRQLKEYSAPASTPYNYQPKSQSPFASNQNAYGGENLAGAAPAAASSAYYPSQAANAQYSQQNYSQNQYPQSQHNGTQYQNGQYQSGQYQGGQYQAPNSQSAQRGPQYPNYQGAPQGPYSGTPRPRSWKDKLGFGNLKTTFNGLIRGGVAATQTDDWRADYVGEVKIDTGVSAITQGGMEYGVNLEVRGQYDKYRRGFGGRVGDCPAANPECASTGGATPVAVRGHTSQFYTGGPSNAKESEIALEGAYVFLRSAYGDVTLGRDDGAAYLFSLGAPSLMAVNASNSPLDYTGLDSVKTVNDASGFSEKITYTSPRLGGDQIGIGLQIGASYALNARACGVDYCVRKNEDDASGTLAPDLENVMEVGLALDRTFDNGLKVEATGTYARASEQSGLDVFDDLSAWNTGIEFTLADWTLGGSYLQSNNGLADGDYTAWDAGITWKPSKFGFSASYGQAMDDNVSLKSNQAVAGVTYEFDKFTLGTGVQYIERETPFVTGGIREIRKEDATALFIEGGFKF